MRALCVGEDFALGRGREGTCARCARSASRSITVPLVHEAGRGEKISSSALRARLAAAAARVAASRPVPHVARDRSESSSPAELRRHAGAVLHGRDRRLDRARRRDARDDRQRVHIGVAGPAARARVDRPPREDAPAAAGHPALRRLGPGVRPGARLRGTSRGARCRAGRAVRPRWATCRSCAGAIAHVGCSLHACHQAATTRSTSGWSSTWTAGPASRCCSTAASSAASRRTRGPGAPWGW